MVEEDYVSFETAKLLKEKGFDEPCFRYAESKKIYESGAWMVANVTGGAVGIPTLQMAMKWLREAHNLHIDVDPSEGNWNPTVLELENWTCAVKFGDNIPIQDSYEQACEAAIKYCLENLI